MLTCSGGSTTTSRPGSRTTARRSRRCSPRTASTAIGRTATPCAAGTRSSAPGSTTIPTSPAPTTRRTSRSRSRGTRGRGRDEQLHGARDRLRQLLPAALRRRRPLLGVHGVLHEADRRLAITCRAYERLRNLLRRRRQPRGPEGQDDRDPGLRLPGPRARAEPEGVRLRRRRRAASRLVVPREGGGRRPRGARRRRRRQPRRRGDGPAARRTPGRDLGSGDPRRDRRGQPADVRPRLLDPLRPDRAAARRRRRHGGPEGARAPGPQPSSRRAEGCRA